MEKGKGRSCSHLTDLVLSEKLELCISVERERGKGGLGWRFRESRRFEIVIVRGGVVPE